MSSKTKLAYSDIAHKQLHLIHKKLLNKQGHLMYKANISIASLWDFSAYFTAIVKAFIDNPNKNKDYLDKALIDLEWYLVKDREDNHLMYASENGKEAPVFYDDNIWIVIGLLNLYEVTRNETHLNKAKKILEFIYASWQTKSGGGLLWKEFTQDFKPEQIVRNTCINAPAAYASALVYKLTQDEFYLNWATTLYDWTRNVLKDPKSGLYFDNISQNNIIEETYWTYNTGVMIAVSSLLNHLTGKEEYAQHALESIESAFSLLSVEHSDQLVGFKYFDDHPWFRVYLFQGLYDAYQYLKPDKKDIIEKYFDEILSGFIYMYETYQNMDDFILDKWSKTPNKTREVESLFASGNLESLYIFQAYQRCKEKGDHK